MLFSSHSNSDKSESESDSEADYICPICGQPEMEGDKWIECVICKQWFHLRCTELDSDCDVGNLDWQCVECIGLLASWTIHIDLISFS